MIELINITKKFNERVVINNLNLSIKKNEFVSLTGLSGSGKTTILNIIGMIVKPTAGDVVINGSKNFSSKEIQNLRRYHFGYIFQNYALIENETVEKNFELSKKFNSSYSDTLVLEVLKTVGLNQTYLKEKVYNLSGGEQQRVAIARTMLKKCDIILADEPTGNLDETNKKIVIDLLLKLKESGKTIICVTHDKDVANAADRIIKI